MNKKQIIDAYCELRKTNQSIPDDVLDFMKKSALEKLERDAPASMVELKQKVDAAISYSHLTFDNSIVFDLKRLLQYRR